MSQSISYGAGSQPTVSVVTVCYNSASTLRRTLESVMCQSWPHIEHVVIDGNSTDGTEDLLNEYRSHLACIVREPDHGIYDAMNKGIARSTGEILCFLNADDTYADDQVLETVVRRMQMGRLDALFGDVAFFKPGTSGRVVRRYGSHKFSPARIPFGWMPAHPAMFMRRKIYLDLGGFRTHYRIAGDFEFVARAFGPGTLRYEHLARVLVMMQAGGVSTAGLHSTLLLNKEVLQACRENGIRTNIFKILSKYPAKLMELIQR
ncbi:MAG: glycosyltransferase [Burkholderiales bacterium]|nr:glycosyltransferase [Burkholderiales bacterium]